LIKYGELRVAGPKLLAVSFGSAAHHDGDQKASDD
jgi:hypothetical protein